MVRSYQSAVRDQARDETRQRIFEATVRVVKEQGVHAFTIQNVAIAAGVAHRTVYRYFPTREALLEGLAGTLEEASANTPVSVPPIAEWEAVVARTFEQFARNADLVSAVHAASVALRHPLAARTARSRGFRERVAEAFPNLSRDRHIGAANIVRNVISSTNWLSLTTEHGMSSAAALRAVTWALRALLAELADENAAARASR